MNDNRLNPIKVGYCVGIVVGMLHLAWALVVGLGYGQSVTDFVYAMHFVQNTLVIRPFELSTAILLVAASSVGGFLIGASYSALWNLIAARELPSA